MFAIVHDLLEQFNFEFMRIALCGTLLVGLTAGILSPLVVLKERSYISDLIAHYIFPGVVGAYMLAFFFHLPGTVLVIPGALFSALLGSYFTEFVTKRLKTPSDAVSIVSLAGFFGMGAIILSKRQGIKVNLESFLFGDVLSLSWIDIWVLLIILLFTTAVIVYMKTEWEAWLCDPEFAKLSGVRIGFLERIFPFLLTLVVLSSLFAAGSLMISAFLALPAILKRPKGLLDPFSILISLSLSLLGFLLSIEFDTPIGSTIVVVSVILVAGKALMVKQK